MADNVLKHGAGAINIDACRIPTDEQLSYSSSTVQGVTAFGTGRTEQHVAGRWPANLIHDGSDEVIDVFPDESARFFYCPKADKNDRDAGLSRAESTPGQKTNRKEGSAGITPYAGTRVPTKNNHPTVKPVDLMRYLCRLVTQPGGVVLDPFMGSGSTGKACKMEGYYDFIGIEKDPEYFEIAKARIENAKKEDKQTTFGAN